MKPFMCIRLLPLFAAVLLCASSTQAQQGYRPNEDEFDPGPKTFVHPEKKSRSLFHRPNEDTPAEQFAFAVEREKAGRLRSAKDAYDDLVHHWHDSQEAPEAQFALARILFEQGKYEKAFKAFQY